jgi:acyl-CoA hydrolase
METHELAMTVLMTPDMANFSGKVHGGALLKLLDQVAYACASRYAASYVVTVSVDQVVFRQPIHVGELVSFLASVNHVGTSSMEVGIKVLAENIQTRATRHVNSCFFTMVASPGTANAGAAQAKSASRPAAQASRRARGAIRVRRAKLARAPLHRGGFQQLEFGRCAIGTRNLFLDASDPLLSKETAP